MTTKPATIYLDSQLHKVLKLKAVETNQSISDLVNIAIRHELAEDLDDIKAYQETKNEKLIPYEDVLKKLKSNGKI